MSAYETQPEGRTDTEHATVVGEGARWKGRFTEYNRYGEPTGARYVRCSECGVGVLAGDTRHATHRDGCDGPEKQLSADHIPAEHPQRSGETEFAGGVRRNSDPTLPM